MKMTLPKVILQKLFHILFFFFCFSRSFTIAGAFSPEEFSRGKNQTCNDNSHSSEILASSQDIKTTRNDDGRTMSRGARIQSNQHGIISVSVVVEIEENIMTPIQLPSNKEYSSCVEKGGEEVALLNDGSIFSPQNDSNTIWMISVEEITVGGNDYEKDESESISAPHSQRVHLEWNKANKNSQDTINKFDSDSKNFNRSQIHYSGSANYTFMIPLKGYDRSLQAQPLKASSSSLARTFIVSLIQSTQTTPGEDEMSLSYDSRNNHQQRPRKMNTALTRRLATLPRESNPHSHSRQTIDPVVEVHLYHSQQTSLHKKPRFSEISSFKEPISVSNEETNISDVGEDVDDESTRTPKTSVPSNLLWTLLLLSVLHLMPSMLVRFTMKRLYPFKYVKVVFSLLVTVASEIYCRGDCQENVHNNDELKENVGSEDCGRQEKQFYINTFLDGTTTEVDEAPKLPNVRVGGCHYEENDRTRQQRDNFGNSKDSMHSDDLNLERDERDKGDSVALLQRTQKELPFDHHSLRLRRKNGLAGKRSDAYGPGKTDTMSGNSATSSILSTTHNENNTSVAMKELTTSTLDSSHKSISESQIPQDDFDPKQKITLGGTVIREISIDIKESKTHSDLSFEDPPRVSTSNSTNERQVFDHVIPSQRPKEDLKYSDTSSESRQGSGRRSLSKETGTKAGCKSEKQCKDSEIEVDDGDLLPDHIAYTTHQTPHILGAEEGYSNSFQSISKSKKIGKDEESEIREADETEESYVSTLPPDSDYISEEDPANHRLFSPCSFVESKARTESRLVSNSTRNEGKTNGRSRKRKMSHRCNLPSVEETKAMNTISHTVGSGKLSRKDLDCNDGLDSVQFVRVTIPDGVARRMKRRPYSKSNYVADWVPSNELQSISQEFLQDESWDIDVVPRPMSTSSNLRVVDEPRLNLSKKKKSSSLRVPPIICKESF